MKALQVDNTEMRYELLCSKCQRYIDQKRPVFVNAKVRQQSFQDFLAQWNAQNLVLNDRRAGEKMRLIKTELCRKELSCKQSSVSRDAFCYFYHLE